MNVKQVCRLKASRVTGSIRSDTIESAFEITAWPQEGSGELLMEGELVARVWRSPAGLVVELPQSPKTLYARLDDFVNLLNLAAMRPP